VVNSIFTQGYLPTAGTSRDLDILTQAGFEMGVIEG
jgi:hypothetical protein